MSICNSYNPDKVFQRIKLVEFPTSMVGLSNTQILDVETDLNKSAYLKTFCEGQILKFEEAREISANHRAYTVEQIDEHRIQITYKPSIECINKAKRKLQLHNRFLVDIRIIKVDGIRCCNNEQHAEIGRYYICGQYDYCQITHEPEVINFGDAFINQKVTTLIRMKNESKLIAADVQFERLNGYNVSPAQFILPPNSTKRLTVSISPCAFIVPSTLMFKIRNCHHISDVKLNTNSVDENYITYIIHVEINILNNKKPNIVEVESLHKLYDPLPKYTYLDEELKIHNQRKAIALKYSELSKSHATHAKMLKKVKEKYITGNIQCYPDTFPQRNIPVREFCEIEEPQVSTYDLFEIDLFPNFIDFSKVGISTYGKRELTIKNGTKFNITVQLCRDEYVVYTANKLPTIVLKLKPLTQSKVVICCLGSHEGNFERMFEYIIDNKFKLKHMYSLEVSKPKLMIMDKSLKFGMVTTDSFIMSVPLRIYNEFNCKVNFTWADIFSEIPFEVMPMSGSIPGLSCKICDIWYNCKPTKTKTHEIECISECNDTQFIPIELSIVTRKLSIKFLQPVVIFKEIALNLETIVTVRLENSSREMALFQVLEPLIPGFRLEPMQGIIRPKMVMPIDIIVKIPCVLEFSFDILVKINNKEIVTLSVSGIVVDPKINIYPKNIFMPRVPCELISYVPVVFQNMSKVRTEVEVLDTGDDNIFDIYIAQGQVKERVFEFNVEGGQSKTVFIKVYDTFRREYDMYIPFKINGLLGPPIYNQANTTEFNYYIGSYEELYENNPKVKVKSSNREISYCRIVGVFTVPWLKFSVEKFEFDFVPEASNTIHFTMTNISKYNLYITILTSKLFPNFSLQLETQRIGHTKNTNETLIAFELNVGEEVELSAKFHPKLYGKWVATAILFLDKAMSIPYSNLTFYGKQIIPAMTPSSYRVIFPPCYVGTIIKKIITIHLEAECNIESIAYLTKLQRYLSCKFIDLELREVNHEMHTFISVEVALISDVPYSGHGRIIFSHQSESRCVVDICFCVTYCPLTLHVINFTQLENNPYPYYPLSTQTELYEYLEISCAFLEKWMFQQGFRRDLYPIIPDSFHAISAAMAVQAKSGKGINVSYLNFIRKIAGPLMKHVRKTSEQDIDGSFKQIKEIHDTYLGIIRLLKSRSANLPMLQAKFLLSYEQFIVYENFKASTTKADIVLTKQLLADVDLFKRLNKQCWIDFILQTYKVFVMDSCFFECACMTNEPRNIEEILVDWYNEQIRFQHNTLKGKDTPIKLITNITTDLIDGTALASAIMNYCPFLVKQFSTFCDVTNETEDGDIINNACLVIEAMNQLRLFFPLTSKDFFEPNYIQMLFLSIHLYVVLPMFKPRDTIVLSPPLLRSSNRQVSISSSSQETLVFSYVILNNNRNSFLVEKIASQENGKKMHISVKYIANFVNDENCLLLIHGYNKTRIFDTYVTFFLHGQISALHPERKCRVTGALYRPMKVDILIGSPFHTTADFDIHITDIEPTIPVCLDLPKQKPQFFLRRLNLIDTEMTLYGQPKDSQPENIDQKMFLLVICLSTQIGNSWIWFKSDIGHFFVRVTTQPRSDIAIDTLQSKVLTWPMDPCSCGEACECYRTTVISIPHRNDLMLKGLRAALVEHASPTMMNIYDQLIETMTGKLLIAMLLEEGGTNMSEIRHLLQTHTTYRIWSRTLLPRMSNVELSLQSNLYFSLPITLPPSNTTDKYSITLTSDCGMDVRTYKIVFVNLESTALVHKSKDILGGHHH